VIKNLSVLAVVWLLGVSAVSAEAVVYDSVFETYKPFKVEPLKNWPAANEAVREAGGWRALLKEANEPDAPVDPKGPAKTQGTAPNPNPTPAPVLPRANPAPGSGHQHHQHGVAK
jgi:hypothetical protein